MEGARNRFIRLDELDEVELASERQSFESAKRKQSKRANAKLKSNIKDDTPKSNRVSKVKSRGTTPLHGEVRKAPD